MKTLLLFTVLSLGSLALNAQNNLDQNPNYQKSMDYYMKQKDELQQTMNTTVQNTYKAFDWYQNKLDKKQQRRDYRQQVRLTRASAPSFYYYPHYTSYNRYHRNWNYHYNNWWFWF
jgi:lipopolysaccharide export LptBFGC system permease protein LptF